MIEKEIMFLELSENVDNVTENMESALSLESIVETIVTWLATEGVKLVIGFLLLLLSFWIINGIAKKFKKTMTKKNRDKTITTVVYNVIKKGGKFLVFLVFLGYVGIDTAGVGTVIASLGVGISLAVQGSLSNLAGGLIILVMRPFKIGDYIVAQGESGTVEEIKVFYTYLTTPDNKVVMIPNGALANGNITNTSAKELRRVDFEFGISYNSDYELAKKVINEVISNHELILADPSSFVRVSAHGDSSINIATKVWVKKENYWTVYYDVIETIKTKFDENNIEIPYNTIDINLRNDK